MDWEFSCSLFLKHLLSSSPQSSGSECPRRVGLGPFADFLLSTPPGSRSAHMVWFCVGAEHMHKGSTPSLWRSRNSVYLFIPEESYSPFILPQPAAGLLLAQQLEYELSAFLGGQEGLNADGSSAEPGGHSQREGGCHPSSRDPDKSTLLPPQTSFFLSFVPREGFAAVVLWQCPEKRDRHFSVSQLQLRYLRRWHKELGHL